MAKFEMMPAFNDRVIRLGDDFDNERFPERFANEIYLSKVHQEFYYRYRSPFSIKYVFAGQDIYTVGSKLQKVQAGDVLVINDGEDVLCERILSKNNMPGIGMSIFLDTELVSDVLSSFEEPSQSLPFFYDSIIRDDKGLPDFLGSIFKRYYFSGAEEIPVEIYYSIAEHLLQFQCRFLEKTKGIDKVKYSTRKEIFERVYTAKEYLESTYMGKFDLETLAKECALSKYFLIRSFKSVYNKTPQQYFIELKINKAKDMLKKVDRVGRVANELGYTNIHCFSRQFKKVTGYSPLDFKVNNL